MKFWEAIRAIQEGKKVRGVEWKKESYIHLSSDQLIIDEDGYVEYSLYAFVPMVWELYLDNPQSDNKIDTEEG